MPLDIIVRLWSRPGHWDGFRQFEDRALQIMADHGAQLVRIERPSGKDCPDEVHHLTFPDLGALEAYRADPRVQAMASLRKRVILKSEIEGAPI